MRGWAKVLPSRKPAPPAYKPIKKIGDWKPAPANDQNLGRRGGVSTVRILENEARVQEQAVAAQRSLDLSVTCYKGGVTSYLEVITAQSPRFQMK
jgi:hypothetical protein